MIFFERISITRHDGDQYLDRLRIIDCPWFGIYLHRFEGSDDECLHDHPWPFVSIILRGGYFEYVGEAFGASWDGSPRWQQIRRRWHGVGSILFRRANHAHRVELDHAKPQTISLVIRGPRSRPWGFFTRLGWLPWQQYHYGTHCERGTEP